MDNITHTLSGLMLYGLRAASLPAADEKALLVAVILSANAPDIDVFAPLLRIPLEHRGPTHSVPGAVVLAVATALLVQVVYRPENFWRVLGITLLGVAVHLGLDLLTAYGTRALLPWSSARLATDTLAIVDPIVIFFMGMSIYAADRYVPRLTAYRLGVIALLLFIGFRAGTHYTLKQRVTAMNPQAEKVSVLPGMFNWRTWSYVVEQGDSISTGSVRLGNEPSEGLVLNKPGSHPAVVAALKTREGEYFAGFARHLYVEVDETAEGFAVVLSDARYRMRNRSVFYAKVVLDNEFNVLSATSGR